MIDISISNLTKAFEVNHNILDGLTFDIERGERVGILGRNGTGKTTLFRLIVGELSEDEGDIIIPQGRRVGLISQIPHYPEGTLVSQVLRAAFGKADALRCEMDRLEAEMERGDISPADLKRYGDLAQRYEAEGGFMADVEIAKVANGLEITGTMKQQEFSRLSGGEQTRVNLARLILENTDILLLDEPTNHLDLNAVEWLEEYLARFKGTVLVISHDRYFLDRVVTRIVEIVEGKAEHYSGNYSFYVVEKQRRFEEKLKIYEKNQAKIEQLKRAAENLHLWAFMGNDKLHKRAFSMEKRIARLDAAEKPRAEKRMKARIAQREFRGDELLRIEGLTKRLGERMLFSDVELLVTKAERIGIVGDNGAGKTTLIRTILGELSADSGQARFGPQVHWAYLPQQVIFENPERSLLDTMIYELNLSPQSARNRLAAFQFTGDDVFKPVEVLSGGERSRLRLCMLMNEEINLLILDEPTNHLDVASREWIEQVLEEYEGALIFISHDRYFISRFAERIWELRDGCVTDYLGTFEQYRNRKQYEQQRQSGEKKERERKPRPKRPKSVEKQIEALEKQIDGLERERAELELERQEKASDYEALMTLQAIAAEKAAQLDELIEQWERLSEQIQESAE